VTLSDAPGRLRATIGGLVPPVVVVAVAAVLPLTIPLPREGDDVGTDAAVVPPRAERALVPPVAADGTFNGAAADDAGRRRLSITDATAVGGVYLG
jgi:hypothetical protein